MRNNKSIKFLIILFIPLFFLFSCISTDNNSLVSNNLKTSTPIKEKIKFSPFKLNKVNDKYKYPEVPADGLIYNYFNNILNLNYSENKDIKKFIEFNKLIEELAKYDYFRLMNSIKKVNEIIKQSEYLNSKFLNTNQFFQASYYYSLMQGFKLIKNSKNQKDIKKYQSLYDGSLWIYRSGEKRLFKLTLTTLNFVSEKLPETYYPDFLKGKLYIALKNFRSANLSFYQGIKKLNLIKTKDNKFYYNMKAILNYYYSTKINKFYYSYNIGIYVYNQNVKLKLKMIAPKSTKFQNLVSVKVFDNNKLLNFKIEKNAIDNNILILNINKLSNGFHNLKIEYKIKTYPAWLEPENNFKLSDYNYNKSNMFKFGILQTKRLNFNNKIVKDYIFKIKNSIPDFYINNLLYIIYQSYLYVINKLNYNLKMASDPGYRNLIDKKYGVNALRAIKYPEYSVCESYAILLTTILRSFQIPSFFIYGPVYKNPYHAWVKVYLPDGNYLVMDPTFGDPVISNGFDAFLFAFFRGANKIEESIIDYNFLLSEKSPFTNIMLTFQKNSIKVKGFNTVIKEY